MLTRRARRRTAEGAPLTESCQDAVNQMAGAARGAPSSRLRDAGGPAVGRGRAALRSAAGLPALVGDDPGLLGTARTLLETALVLRPRRADDPPRWPASRGVRDRG